MRLRQPLSMSLLLVSALVACGDDSSMMNPPLPAITHQAQINIVHASPDAPAVDVYVDKMKALTVAYHKSSGNLTLPSGMHQLDLRPTGSADSSTPVFTANLVLTDNTKTLLAAIGRLADTSGPTKFTVRSYPFGDSDPTSVKVRLLHASPSAPAVDVATSSSTLISQSSYGLGSSYASLTGDVAAGTKLGLRPAGGTVDLAYATLPAVAKGSSLTAIAFGETNPLTDAATFLSVSTLDEASGTLTDVPVSMNSAGPKAALYVFHASPDAPAVDVTLKDGTKLISNLGYQKSSPLLQVPGGVYDIQVRPTGTSNVALSASVKLIPGFSWTMVCHGLVAAGTDPKTGLMLRALPKPDADAGIGTQFRIVHLASNAPAVDVLAGTTALVQGLGYPQTTSYLDADIAAGTLTVQANGAGKPAWTVTVDGATAKATQGQVVSLFATGNVGVMAKPFTVVAVIESSGDPMTPPTTVALPTVAKP